VDGQVSLFGQEWPCGRTSSAHLAADHPKPAISKRFSRRSSKLKNHTFMLLDLRPGAGNMLGPCWEYDPVWLGSPGILNTSECPKNVVDCSLSQILEAAAPSRYFLTKKACLGILRRSRERGKPLPHELETACKIQAGLMPMPASGVTSGAGFTAGFNAGAGASAGSIAYHREAAPTLKGTSSGNMMPTVLCLNDQGGQCMGVTENVTGTLRAQDHGHPPLILFDNHAIDARYTGPHEIAPTLTRRSGTGGNNLPIIQQRLFARQWVDRFEERETASTVCTRQHKDTTDLVWQGADDTCDDHSRRALLLRRLMPIEAERLMGYPDHWTDLPRARDAPRFRSLGNSVVVQCVEYLMQGVKLAILADL